MKKPRLEDFKRDVYDGQHLAEWYEDYHKALERYIDSLTELNQPWISVDERTPEKDQDVLVWAETWQGEIGEKERRPGVYHVKWKSIQQCEILNGDCYASWVESITHWMPEPMKPIIE